MSCLCLLRLFFVTKHLRDVAFLTAPSVVRYITDGDVTDLVGLLGEPVKDLFASLEYHRLPQFVTRASVTQERGPADLRMDLHKWPSVTCLIILLRQCCQQCAVGSGPSRAWSCWWPLCGRLYRGVCLSYGGAPTSSLSATSRWKHVDSV